MMFRNRAETESKNFARLREESISHVIVYEFLNPCLGQQFPTSGCDPF